MTCKLLTFGVDSVYAQCAANMIDPDATGQILCWIAPDYSLTLYDSANLAGRPESRYVLFAPDLANKYINRTLTVRKQKRVPSGFLVEDALQHQAVFVIGAFSDPELAPLIQAGIRVTRVQGNTPEQIRDHLEHLLSQP